MNSPEINQIEDARILGKISRLSAQYNTYEDFKKAFDIEVAKNETVVKAARHTYARLTGEEPPKKNIPLKIPSEEALKLAYNYSRQEDRIIDSAINLVKDQNRSVNENPKPVHQDWDVNEIGMHIAEGPALTVLDGGPGAGKSFSLGKAADVMQVSVICLGSTESAAAGLYKDMNDAQTDKDKEALKNQKRILHNEQPKEIAPKISILGGLTVDQLLQKKPLQNEDLETRKKEVLDKLKETQKPCIMVDEAGLLGHRQMQRLLRFVEKNGAKVILAGDCQQIPEGKGQPFKTLVESLKDTKAYVNAPYVFRQTCFSEKAITSGIYNGLSSNNPEGINKSKAVEFLEAAYAITGGPAKPPANGEQTFQDYLDNTPTFKDMPGKTPVQKYVFYLEQNKESLLKDGTAKILHDYETHTEYESTLKALKDAEKERKKAEAEGKTDLPPLPDTPKKPDVPRPSYDSYMCAVLAAQQMGVQAYEALKQTKAADNVYDDVAKDFAQNYLQSLEDGLNARKRKDLEKGKDYTALVPEYPDGMLAITATEKEAEDLNKVIRNKMIEQGKLPEKEPVIVNGKRTLLSQDEMEKAQKNGKTVKYAYALDVKTTQGMSQVGKVTFVVRGDTMNKMHGGEILVGATRHKGDFAIKMDQDAMKNKTAFYKASVQQFAAARVIKKAFQSDLYNAAPKDEKNPKSSLRERAKAAGKERRTVMSQLKTIQQNNVIKRQMVSKTKNRE